MLGKVLPERRVSLVLRVGLRALGLVLFSLCLSGITVSATQAANMNLVGAWTFDDGGGKVVKDLVGGNNGEIKGSSQWAPGKLGGGLELPGKGDSYVSIPHKDYFDADVYTIAAWVKLEPKSWQYVFWRDGLEWPEKHLKRHTDMWIMDGSNVAVLMWHLEGGGEGRIDGKTAVADGNWHHVAEWHDGKTMRLYVDGKVDGEAPAGKLIVNGEDPMWLGARPGDVAATGVFDEVGFFTQALAEAEFKAVMGQGLSVIAAVEAQNKLSTTWGELKTR
ncbi:LamG domain-containing protein [Candidatus Poribacteria bacterium]|nr:LamG domain-containing protein [Candidatus Poribacteria bacterium]